MPEYFECAAVFAAAQLYAGVTIAVHGMDQSQHDAARSDDELPDAFRAKDCQRRPRTDVMTNCLEQRTLVVAQVRKRKQWSITVIFYTHGTLDKGQTNHFLSENKKPASLERIRFLLGMLQ